MIARAARRGWGMAGLLAAAGCVGGGAAPPPPAVVRTVEPPRAPPPLPAGDFVLEGNAIQGGMMRGVAPVGTIALSLDGAAVPVAHDRRFLIAFDRDADRQAMLVATRSDGSRIARALAVAPRAWAIERLDRLPRVSRPSAEFLRLRAPELARIAAARAHDTGAEGWRQDFIWPVTGRISGRFGSQRIYKGEPGAYHSGTDVARAAGTPVVAPADGVVVLAADRPFTLEGNLLMLDHGMGLNSAFLHLSRIEVAAGEHVRQGQVIGRVGSTGRATGAHLHWSLKWRDSRVDPELVAGAMPGAR